MCQVAMRDSVESETPGHASASWSGAPGPERAGLQLYTLTPADLEFVAAHRTDANRLGVATQLCFLRHPGRAWTPAEIEQEEPGGEPALAVESVIRRRSDQ
ncbi:MAG: DUF4158 domain-containing protein [Bryobacteraceae bacterium]|jgi:hypothetical protein